MYNLAKYPITDEQVIDCLERILVDKILTSDDIAPGDTTLVCLHQAIKCIKERKNLATRFDVC